MAGLTVPVLRIRTATRFRQFIGSAVAASRSSTLAACTIVCATYVAAGGLGVELLQRIFTPGLAGFTPTLGVPWLAAGVGVSGLLVFGARAWPGVLVGSWIIWGFIQGDSWLPVLLGGASEVASVLLIVWLLRAWGYRPSLERYQDALILTAATAIGRLVTSASDVVGLLGVAWSYSGSRSPLILDEAGVSRSGDVLIVGPALLLYALRWWANTTVGVILVVPLLSFAPRTSGRQSTGASGELLAWTLASLAWLAAALTLPGPILRLALLGTALLLVVWAAARFSVAIASVGALLFSIGATVGFGLQLGVFAGIGRREAIEVQWGFIAVLTGTGLFLTALQSSRQLAQQQLALAVERYRRLFLANPRPMWVEEIDTGRILVVNGAAVSAYGYSADHFAEVNGATSLRRRGPIRIRRATECHDSGTSVWSDPSYGRRPGTSRRGAHGPARPERRTGAGVLD